MKQRIYLAALACLTALPTQAGGCPAWPDQEMTVILQRQTVQAAFDEILANTGWQVRIKGDATGLAVSTGQAKARRRTLIDELAKSLNAKLDMDEKACAVVLTLPDLAAEQWKIEAGESIEHAITRWTTQAQWAGVAWEYGEPLWATYATTFPGTLSEAFAALEQSLRAENQPIRIRPYDENRIVRVIRGN